MRNRVIYLLLDAKEFGPSGTPTYF